MSDEQSTGGVRRFGRKDRKRSLDPRGPLFPLEDDIPAEPAVDKISDLPEPDLSEPVLAQLVEPPSVVQPPPIRTQPKRNVNPSRPASSGGKHIVANLLTIVFLLGTIGMGALIAVITKDPYTPLNPFPPFTPLPIVITATFLPPTATAEGTAAPTATFTPIALDSAPAAETAFTFALVPAQPIYAPNANTEGCNWSSIAGTVTSSSGTALDGYRIHISGNGLDETVFSGAALTFGAGGFELFINGTAQEQTFTVQLLDPQREPLSPEYSVTTRAGCDENVAVLSFVGS